MPCGAWCCVLWRRLWFDHLPTEYQELGPPDLAAVQAFEWWQHMNYHCDQKRDRRRPDQPIAQAEGSPVLSLNLFEDFLFWTVPIVNGDVIDKKQKLDTKQQMCIRMSDNMSMLWPKIDDDMFKHGVWSCPSNRPGGGLRYSIVFRWSNPRSVERFDLAYPHRIVLSAIEERDEESLECEWSECEECAQ